MMGDSNMDIPIKSEENIHTPTDSISIAMNNATPSGKGKGKSKNRKSDKDDTTTIKRRCVSTACIACRRRKSKCDGQLPKCAACASVYLTECEYAPHTDHRRKGVYKKDIDNLKTRNSTLQTLIQAILNYDEEDVPELVHQIRTCDNLEDLADQITAKEKGLLHDQDSPDSPVYPEVALTEVPQFDAELSGKMGDLWLDGSVKFIGGTSILIWLPEETESAPISPNSTRDVVQTNEEAVLSWTRVTQDKDLVFHFLNMYFCWHYTYFTTLSKEMFYRDFLQGVPSAHCSSFLVNIMLALGCHFSSKPDARADPDDSATTGDHYFAEAKRMMAENDEFANAKLCTVQALALMSVREAGCGRETTGWVYSGMSFRMACDLGLNVDAPPINENSKLRDDDEDARRITFWGCFLFDKCWSNYLGRQPQLQMGNITVKKPVVFPSEDSEMWSPYTDSGIIHQHNQPARTRAVALEISKLAEISSELLVTFYHPVQMDKPMGKQAELKKLSDLHTRLEAWKSNLPAEFEPRDGQLPQVLVMHMFFQLLFIHLYRPFLKYTRTTSPLPSHVSPRKFCTQAAAAISKLFRLYKRTHGLRQICNIAVYIAHSACTIHLLNLPDKNARRDIIHGLKHLEEIGECWTCARRTLKILAISTEKWKVELPDEALATFARTHAKWGVPEPHSSTSPMNTHEMLDIGVLARRSNSAASPTETVSSFRPLQVSPAAQQQPHLNQPMANLSGITQFQNGFIQRQPPSPASTDSTSRSSGAFSLPPQSAADLARLQTRNREKPSAQLTKQQQDAWNAHRLNQARRGSMQGSAANANILFAGVDGLLANEDVQDWFLQDQSSLANGFENWNDPDYDWGGMGFGVGPDISIGNGYQPVDLSFTDGADMSNGYSAFPGDMPPQKNDFPGGQGRHQGQYGNGYDQEMYF